jgi:hypothetical protein
MITLKRQKAKNEIIIKDESSLFFYNISRQRHKSFVNHLIDSLKRNNVRPKFASMRKIDDALCRVGERS